MNPEQQKLTDQSAQVTNLKQVIIRSEAAIVALQKLVSVAEGKIRTLEAQSQPIHSREHSVSPTMIPDSSLTRLKMFQ